MELTLKRGSGRTFDGKNWNLVADKNWEVQVLYVANRRETFLGKRQIDGVEHAVFQCLDDTYFAQPVSICEMPVPEDPLEVLYSLEAPEVEERKPSKQQTAASKVLTFSGKNWKLAADSKWKSSASFVNYDESSKVGEKTMGQTTFDIYKTTAGFIAVKKPAADAA